MIRLNDVGWRYAVTMGALRNPATEVRFLQSYSLDGSILDLGSGPQSHLLWLKRPKARIAVDNNPNHLRVLSSVKPAIVCLECEAFEKNSAWHALKNLKAVWALYGLFHQLLEDYKVEYFGNAVVDVLQTGGFLILELTDGKSYVRKYGQRGNELIGRFNHQYGETQVWTEWCVEQERRNTIYRFEVQMSSKKKPIIIEEHRSFCQLNVNDVVAKLELCGLYLQKEFSSLLGQKKTRLEEPRRVLVFSKALKKLGGILQIS